MAHWQYDYEKGILSWDNKSISVITQGAVIFDDILASFPTAYNKQELVQVIEKLKKFILETDYHH